MGNVALLLKNVMEAVYGEDVRQSIHDLIKTCYDEVHSLTTVKVSNTKPTDDITQMWINPKGSDFFYLPEIDDNNVSWGDTWSSKRIKDQTSVVDIKWIAGSYINSVGEIIGGDVARMCTELIPCYEGIDVTFIGESSHPGISVLTFYNSNKEIIQLNSCVDGVTLKPEEYSKWDIKMEYDRMEHTLTAPEGTRYLRLSSYDKLGWTLKFSEPPVFKTLGELAYNADNFNDDVDHRIAYTQVINGANQPPYYINQTKATKLDNGSITIEPEGYYFVTLPYGSFGGNAYIGVKYNRDERIDVGFSENGSTTITTVPYIKTKNICGYEVAKIEKFENNDYPYAIIRIDNRGKSDVLTIEDIRIVDGDVPLPDKPHYVSVEGSDDNDGSIDRPFATVNQALLAGASDIYIYPGEYEQTINLDYAHHCEISISSFIPDGRVIFRDPNATIATSCDGVDSEGACYVYGMPCDRSFGSNNIWLFIENSDDELLRIDDSERHPLQRGRRFRTDDFMIPRCTATNVGDALVQLKNERGWYYDESTKYLYVSIDSDLIYITPYSPLCGSNAKSLFLNTRRDMTLKVTGIESKYMAFDVSNTTNSVITDCKATNVCKSGAFIYDHAIGCKFVRCEAARCFHGSNGDGFNAHSTNTGDSLSKQTTATFIDCWSHDNNDDGYSDHERSETTIIGGLYEYNGKGGVTPSYGSHCTCYNVYSRNNHNGFYYTGTVDQSEGGMGGQMICHGCIAETNIYGGSMAGFKVDGVGNTMTLIDCRSISNEVGYYVSDDCYARLVDCRCSHPDNGIFTDIFKTPSSHISSLRTKEVIV